MEMVFRVYLVASVLFVLSYGATINLDNNFELDNSLDENPLSKYEGISEIAAHNSSCPIYPKPADCAEVFENGFRSNGVYKVHPRNKILPCGEIKVYCDMKTDGGGWTVIQRRGDFKRSPDYFHKTWNEYKTGFGNLEKEFWLGNDNIHALTNQKRYSVRFDLGTHNETAYATYDTFWTENEELKYRLYIRDYSGTAGDSMAYHHNLTFSTKDRKNNPGTTDCANERKGGWWYDGCADASLNGAYLRGNYDENMVNTNGTYWRKWKDYKVSLTTVEIKIRPFDFQIR